MLSVSRLLNGSVTEADALRYGRRSKELPPHLLHYSADKKPVVVWTSTRTCNLHCAHCYTDSFDQPYPNELTTAEATAMIDALASFGSPVLLVSGGEPLRRPDLPALAAHARARGMRVVVSTNGTLISQEVAQSLAAAGVSYVGISVDGRPETHDRFRGMRGAFAASMRGLAYCRAAEIKTGLRFTLTKRNVQDLPWLFDLMLEQDVHRLCIYHLAPTGRGERIASLAPTAAETRAALDLVFDLTEAMQERGFECEVLTADNHADAAYLWLRVERSQPERGAEVWRLLEWNGGNRSGEAIACIDSDGSVYTDQFWRWRPQGNIRQRPFASIWASDPPPLLRQMRHRAQYLPVRCQSCRFLTICNGNLRSRAEVATGDLWGADPLCYLTDEEVAGGAA